MLLIEMTTPRLNALALNRHVPLPVPPNRRKLMEAIVASYSDDELRALPDVTSHAKVRDHRADWEAAVLGDMVEQEREEGAHALADYENELAPSIEEIEDMNTPPESPVEDQPATTAATRVNDDGSIDSTADDITDIPMVERHG